MYETVTPEKAPSVKAQRPYPEREEPAAKQLKLQEPDDRYHADLHMQLEGDTELPPFEKRIALFGAAPPEEPRLSPQKRTPSQSPLMPRKALDTSREKPWFTKVWTRHTNKGDTPTIFFFHIEKSNGHVAAWTCIFTLCKSLLSSAAATR